MKPFFQSRWLLAVLFISCCGCLLVSIKWLFFPAPDVLHTWKIEAIIYGFTLSPNGELIALATDSEDCRAGLHCLPTTIQLRQVDTGDLLGIWTATDAQFTADGRFLVTNGGFGIHFWQLPEGIHSNTVGIETYDKLAISPDGLFLAAKLNQAPHLEIWFLPKQKRLHYFEIADEPLKSLTFSPDSQYLAWSGRRNVQVMRVSDGVRQPQLVGYRGKGQNKDDDIEIINDITFNSDGDLLAAGTGFTSDKDCYVIGAADNTVRVWHIAANTPRHVLTEPLFGVKAVAFSPDNSFIVGVGGYYEANLGNTSGAWVCSPSQDNLIRVWNVQNGILLAEIKGHKALTTGISFGPDDTWFITTATDGTVYRWATDAVIPH